MMTAGPPIASGTDPRVARRVRQTELLISRLLRAGVSLSLGIIVGGLVLSFVHHPAYMHDRAALERLVSPGAAFPHSLRDVLSGIGAFQGRAWVALGLLLLIATPVARVAVSIVAFAYQRDRVYVVITSVVLALLLTSFVLGKTSA